MAERNPSSRSSGSGDDKVRVMGGQGRQITENNQSQQKKTEESPSWLIKIWNDGEETDLQRAETNQSQGTNILDAKKYGKIPLIKDDLKRNYTNEEGMNKDKNEDKKEEDCYKPLVVAVGPHHLSDPERKLKTGGDLKVPMTYHFIKESGRKKEEFYKELEKVIEKAKGFYDFPEGINDEEFTRMMFIDGCFVLQFIHYVTADKEELKKGEKFYEEDLKNLSDGQIADMKRDLLLLENQLPFPVLKSLMDLRYGKEKGMEMIDKFLPIRDRRQPFSTFSLILITLLFCILYFCCCCCCCFWPRRSTSSNEEAAREDQNDGKQPAVGDEKQASQYAHLLEYLYLRFTGSPDFNYGKFVSAKQKYWSPALPKRSLATRGHHLYYPAKDLKKVGVHFRPNETGALTDVKLESSCIYGKLELPPITIDRSTKSMLFNLLAYESAFHVKSNLISSYIHFMDSLIDDAEDVKELRSKGILFNYLGPDHQVADLFNNMTRSLKPVTVCYYNDVKRDINKQCESTIKKWVADWQHDYFSNPWTFIAIIAAAFTIFLTAVATYEAVWPIKCVQTP